MHYEELNETEKSALDEVLGNMTSFLKKLNKKDFPEKFFVMDLYKKDEIFGRCIFLKEEDMLKFKAAYDPLTNESDEWGIAIGHVDNSEHGD